MAKKYTIGTVKGLTKKDIKESYKRMTGKKMWLVTPKGVRNTRIAMDLIERGVKAKDRIRQKLRIVQTAEKLRNKNIKTANKVGLTIEKWNAKTDPQKYLEYVQMRIKQAEEKKKIVGGETEEKKSWWQRRREAKEARATDTRTVTKEIKMGKGGPSFSAGSDNMKGIIKLFIILIILGMIFAAISSIFH